MSDTKLCKDCKHAKKPFLGMPSPFRPWTYAKCMAPESAQHDDGHRARAALVDGRGVKTEYYYCITMRLRSAECGTEGKLWEPRS